MPPARQRSLKLSTVFTWSSHPTAMLDAPALQTLLDAVANGAIAPELALTQLKGLAPEAVGSFAQVDQHRSLRTGFPEVIWGQDKPSEQIVEIMQALAQGGGLVMATRITQEKAFRIQLKLKQAQYFPLARICALLPESPPDDSPGPGTIARARTKTKKTKTNSASATIAPTNDPAALTLPPKRYGGRSPSSPLAPPTCPWPKKRRLLLNSAASRFTASGMLAWRASTASWATARSWIRPMWSSSRRAWREPCPAWLGAWWTAR